MTPFRLATADAVHSDDDDDNPMVGTAQSSTHVGGAGVVDDVFVVVDHDIMRRFPNDGPCG